MGVGVGEGVGSRAEVEWKGAARVGTGWSKGRARAGEGQSKGGARAEQGRGMSKGGEGQSKGGQGWGRVDGVLRHTFLGNQLPMIEVLTCPRRGQHA
jgi:hypothetical protein